MRLFLSANLLLSAVYLHQCMKTNVALRPKIVCNKMHVSAHTRFCSILKAEGLGAQGRR